MFPGCWRAQNNLDFQLRLSSLFNKNLNEDTQPASSITSPTDIISLKSAVGSYSYSDLILPGQNSVNWTIMWAFLGHLMRFTNWKCPKSMAAISTTFLPWLYNKKNWAYCSKTIVKDCGRNGLTTTVQASFL